MEIRHLPRYLHLVLAHWQAFAVTGGPGAIVAFIATVAGVKVPLWIWLVIVLVGLFFAQFRVYLDTASTGGSHGRVMLASEPFLSKAVYEMKIHGSMGGPDSTMTMFREWRFSVAKLTDGVQLGCRPESRPVPASIVCEVEGPDGNLTRAQPTGPSGGPVRWVYPTDFNAEAHPGPHIARWYALGKDAGWGSNDDMTEIGDLDFMVELERDDA